MRGRGRNGWKSRKTTRCVCRNQRRGIFSLEPKPSLWFQRWMAETAWHRRWADYMPTTMRTGASAPVMRSLAGRFREWTVALVRPVVMPGAAAMATPGAAAMATPGSRAMAAERTRAWSWKTLEARPRTTVLGSINWVVLTAATGTNSRAALTTASRAVGSWTPVSNSRRGTMGPPRTRMGAMDPIIVSNGLTSQQWLRRSRSLVTQITFRFPSTHRLRRVSSTVSGCGTLRKRSPKVWTSGQSKGGGNFRITNGLVGDNRSLVTLLQGFGELPRSTLRLHLFPSLV